MIRVIKKRFFLLIILPISVSLLCNYCFADTVYLKDKSTLKGIVVEDYVDRIVYSTIDGEREILKSKIIRINYDEPIDNLVNLGDAAFKKGYYKGALKYYLMAQEINPNISILNNKIYHTEATIYKTPELQKREHLALKSEIMSGHISQPSPTRKVPAEEALRRDLGIYLTRKGGRFYIKDMIKKSPFEKAGARKGDVIIAIWSHLCSYFTTEDLYASLTKPGELMTSVTIERDLTLRGTKPLEANLVMQWEGSVINTIQEDGTAKKAGFKNDDLIIAINGNPTRYTPLKTVVKKLQEMETKTVVTIQRKLTIFR